MIITKVSTKRGRPPKTKTFLTIKLIRKLGRLSTPLSFDQLLNRPKTKPIRQKQSNKRKSLTKIKMPSKVETPTEQSAEVEAVIDCVVASMLKEGELHHLVKWRNTSKCALFKSSEVNKRWPQELIQYYQKSLVFDKNIKNKTQK